MQGTSALVARAATLLGADTTTLAEATPFVAVALCRDPFTPSPDLEFADIVLADFDGGDPIHAASAATQVSIDPNTGDRIMQVRDPAGGWYWIVTGVTNLPQTIFGYVLLNAAEDTLLASAVFTTPVILSAVGQSITVGNARITLPFASLV